MTDVDSALEVLSDEYDLDEEELRDELDTKKAELREKDKLPEDASEDQANKFALAQMRAEITKEHSVPSGSEVRVTCLGHDGVREDFGGSTVMFAYGIIEPEDDPAQPGVLLLDEDDGLEPWALMDEWKFGKVFDTQVTIRDAEKVNDRYRGGSTPETELTEVDDERDLSEIREWVNSTFFEDAATLRDIDDSVSIGARGEGFAEDFGADIKRINGTIARAFTNSEGTNGGYIVQDDSYMNPEDIPGSIQGESNIPGLTVWMHPSMMEYGEGSIVHIYGTISQNEDMEYMMNGYGVAPTSLTNDLDLESDDSSGSSSNDPADEKTI